MQRVIFRVRRHPGKADAEADNLPRFKTQQIQPVAYPGYAVKMPSGREL